MRCEVVSIGTELLLGQITDTNSSWIGEQLARIGVDSHFQMKVGDNHGRIVMCLRTALERADAVICCGGLGPTQDDITREAIAEVMDVSLRRDPEIEQAIVDLFRVRGRTMTDNNRRQADIPEGAVTIPEMPGTAPGLICPVGDKVIYAVPGVPSEMREMMQGTVLPDLRRRCGVTAVIRSRVLRTWGYGESGLAETLADRVAALDQAGNPTLAFLASGIEGIKVRITAKAENEARVEELLAREELEVRSLLGDVVFGIDDQSMETVVLDDLKAKGYTLAVAESITGGLAAARLSALDADMETFIGSWIRPYGATDARVPVQERAEAEAARVRMHYGADLGVSVAKGSPADDLPPGTVVIAISDPGGIVSHRVSLPGSWPQLREYAVIHLLDRVRRFLIEAKR